MFLVISVNFTLTLFPPPNLKINQQVSFFTNVQRKTIYYVCFSFIRLSLIFLL